MTHSTLSLFALAALLLCAATSAPAQEAHIYKEVAGRKLKLTIVNPPDWKTSDKRPALIFFHGGGWTGGSPNQFNEHSKYFASRGLVCAQVEYRLLEGKSKEPPTVCIQDAKSAMRWVRSHAGELGIDPERIGAGGGSAGGHLAAFVGVAKGVDDPNDDLKISAKANALVLFNPVFDNGPDQGWGTARVGDRYNEFSPAHNITAGAPPTIVFLGTKDALIPVPVVERFKKNMEKVGSRCDAVYYEGQAHGFFNYRSETSRYYYETTIAADKFLASLGWLKGEPTLKVPAITEEEATKKKKK